MSAALAVAAIAASATSGPDGMYPCGQSPVAGVFSLPAQALNEAPSFACHANRAMLIVLFQPACPFCLIQFREAQTFTNTHRDIGVIAVAMRGSIRELLVELHRARTAIPAYRGSPPLLDALGNSDSTPRMYAVASSGRIVAAQRGLQSQEGLGALADAALGRLAENASVTTR